MYIAVYAHEKQKAQKLYLPDTLRPTPKSDQKPNFIFKLKGLEIGKICLNAAKLCRQISETCRCKNEGCTDAMESFKV